VETVSRNRAQTAALSRHRTRGLPRSRDHDLPNRATLISRFRLLNFHFQDLSVSVFPPFVVRFSGLSFSILLFSFLLSTFYFSAALPAFRFPLFAFQMTSTEFDTLIDGLPGAELITTGLADAARGRVTIPACLVWIAQPRLRRAGLLSEGHAPAIKEPELTLYRLLRSEGNAAFSQYNSFLRRLVSFERALDQRARQSAARLPPQTGDTR